MASQENERKRIAAELHDGLGHRLVLIQNLALTYLHGAGRVTDREGMEEISTEASLALSEVREISYDLRPLLLDRFGLTKAIESIVQAAGKASPTVFTSEIDRIDGVLPPDLEINLYRIVQECLNNIVKHAHAATAAVAVRQLGSQLVVNIKDDGVGFSGSPSDGFGLATVSERALLFGCNAEIRSSAGKGTDIVLEVDLERLRNVR